MVGPVAYATMGAPGGRADEASRAAGPSSICPASPAFIAQPNRWTYNAAKGAVHNLTKCMA